MRALLVSVALLMLAATAGCAQGVGDRCEVDSDCQSGLICSGGMGAAAMGGMGTCQPINSGLPPPPPVDSGPNPGSDGGDDATPSDDGAPDTGPSADAATDVPIPDAAGVE
jgi:hypothetical protein